MGLLGPNGPMPLAFADHVRARRAKGDRTLNRFLDILNHRMVSLFYRAWALHQRTVGFDRPTGDRWAVYVGSLFGLGSEALRRRDDVTDVAKIHFAGRLVAQSRNADGLAAICGFYFGVPARVEQFVGQFIDIPAENRCYLGLCRGTGTLGTNVLVGSKVWDVQQKFRIVLGPMGRAAYDRMLPCGTSFRRLVTWVANYAGFELEWELQLILTAPEVPEISLRHGGYLGWSTWLLSGRETRDRGDLILDSGASERIQRTTYRREAGGGTRRPRPHVASRASAFDERLVTLARHA
jgi:type VI secretion system protein ImpH